MLSTRTLARATARTVTRPQQSRFTFQSRRFASGTSKASESTFVKEREAVKKHAAESSELWRKISLYVVPPALIVTAINAYNLWNEHWEHWEHEPALEDRVEYSYQNVRSKNYFWGDGDKTLFWNPKVNYHKQDE
ncbi:Cytochrome c oxidase subunit 13, mitochondrial [Maublancomyces gigas]|uniref:Cytochrome c oxidase subunit n=1 Tax=Discina gigas TaxID=1032678 RepID=A0ABR3G966_9PEZI